MKTAIRFMLIVILVPFVSCPDAGADVVWDNDFTSWQGGAGTFTTIGFDEGPSGLITEQYAHLGVHFTDGHNWAGVYDPVLFPVDGHGMIGWEEIMLVFDQPITAFAVHYPGSLEVEFFYEGELVHHSLLFGSGFIGFVADTPFDQVRVFDDHDGDVNVDNLYFGPPIPAPPVFAILGVMLIRRRRRRELGASP